MPDSQSSEPGFESLFGYRFEDWAFHFSPIDALVDSAVNEHLAIDSGGNVSDIVLSRNCCQARMLPGESRVGVGMNRSAREGKKCKALCAVQLTGYCAI